MRMTSEYEKIPVETTPPLLGKVSEAMAMAQYIECRTLGHKTLAPVCLVPSIMRIISRPWIYCIAENNRTNKQQKLILLIWGYNTTCISNNQKYNGRPIWSYLVFKDTSCEINICHSQSTGCEGDLALKSVTSLLARTDLADLVG